MLIMSKFKVPKAPLLIITLILLITNLVQFYFIYNQKQQAISTFFLQSRLNREQIIAKAIPTYKTIIDDPNASLEVKKVMESKLTNLISNTTIEIKLEATLKGKGFTDCFIQIYDNKATVFIKTNSKKISSNKLKAIQAIIFEATNIKDIEITPKY